MRHACGRENAPAKTSGVKPNGPASEEVLEAGDNSGRRPRIAAGASSRTVTGGLRSRRPATARKRSGPCRAPSAGTGRNPWAPIGPGSTACRRTSRLAVAVPLVVSLAAFAGAENGANTSPAIKKIASSRPRWVEMFTSANLSYPAAMETSAGSLIRQKRAMNALIWRNSVRDHFNLEESALPSMHAVVFGRRVRRVSAQIRILLHLVRLRGFAPFRDGI